MNQEDIQKALEAISKGGITVAGDLVLEKKVEYEVANVEAGGIGIQIINGKQTDDVEKSSTKKSCGGRPKNSGSKIRTAFSYKGELVRVNMLYQGLCALEWIDDNTDQQLFLDLFSGGEVSQRIIWKGDANTLAELFRRLVNERQFVKLPEKQTIWVMVCSHFWNLKHGEEFDSDKLRNTHPPKENEKSISSLVNILDPELTLNEVREMMQSQR